MVNLHNGNRIVSYYARTDTIECAGTPTNFVAIL